MKLDDIKEMNISRLATIEVGFHPIKIDRETGRIKIDTKNLAVQFGAFLDVIGDHKPPLLHYRRSLWYGEDSPFHIEDCRQRIDTIEYVSVLYEV